MQKKKQTNYFLKVLLLLAIGILLVSMIIAIAPAFEEESGYDKLIIVAELVFLVLIAMVIFNLLGQDFLVNKRDEGSLQLQEVFENASSGLAVVALDGKFIQANRVFCDITGYENEELEQLTFKDITHPEDRNADAPHIGKLLDGSLSSYHIKKRYIHKNGAHVWVNLWGSVIKDKENKPLYLVGQVQKVPVKETAPEKNYPFDHTNFLQSVQVPNIPIESFEPA